MKTNSLLFTFLFILGVRQIEAQISVKKYTWKNPPAAGTYNGHVIPLGGASGLSFVKGTSDECYTITDRGPNLDAGKNRFIEKNKNAPNAKIFPLPAFTPEILYWKLQGDSIVLKATIPLKRPDQSLVSGLVNPPQHGGTGELALTDTLGHEAKADAWGIDSEGICEGNKNDFWICEEYGPSVWHVNKATGTIIKRYTPFPLDPKTDVRIDEIFKYRNPNKGFEGIACTPQGKVFAFLQNPMQFPVEDKELKRKTRLHRFIEIDPVNNKTRMFAYEHDPVQASGPLSSIRNEKRYIGDAAAVNEYEFLILEHGKSNTESYAKIYKIDIRNATPINKEAPLGYNGKSLEQLYDSTTALAAGVRLVKKTLFLDLMANGYDAAIEKEEGLAIVNDTTIAIANDNDFDIDSPLENGDMISEGNKTYLYVFTVPSSMKLSLSRPKTSGHPDTGMHPYPLRRSTGTVGQK